MGEPYIFCVHALEAYRSFGGPVILRCFVNWSHFRPLLQSYPAALNAPFNSYVTCPVNLQFGFLIAFHKVKAPHRHHKRKKLHKAYSCYFHCVAGCTHKCIRPLSPGDPPTSVSPSASPRPISVQNPWPERKDMSHRLLICLIRRGCKISIKISVWQAMALKQAQKNGTCISSYPAISDFHHRILLHVS